MERQLESLIQENQMIKEVSSQELMKDFSVPNYVKWRSCLQSGATQFPDPLPNEDPNGTLSLQRENVKLKDEVMTLRVESFAHKQTLEEN